MVTMVDAGTQHTPSMALSLTLQNSLNSRTVSSCFCNKSPSEKRVLSLVQCFSLTIALGPSNKIETIQVPDRRSNRIHIPAPIRKIDSPIQETTPTLQCPLIVPMNPFGVINGESQRSVESKILPFGAQKQAPADRALPHLQTLKVLLCRIFSGGDISESDFQLRRLDLHILVEIFIRKNRSTNQHW